MPSPIGPSLLSAAADNAAVGTIVWVNSANILSDTDSGASATATGPGTTHYEVVTVSLATLGVPGGATPVGIQFDINRHGPPVSIGSVLDSSVKAVLNGAISGSEQSASQVWSVSLFRLDSFGGSANLMGIAPVATDSVGIAFSAGIATGGNATADYVHITVWYTTSTKKVKDVICARGIVVFAR
jgi:hypothetical protein